MSFSVVVRSGGKIELLMASSKTSRTAVCDSKALYALSLPFSTSSDTHLDALHDVVKRADARVDPCGVLWGRLFLDVRFVDVFIDAG